MNDQQRAQLARAEQARRIIEDPVVVDALAMIKNAIRDQVFDLPVEAHEQREKLIMMDKARAQFETIFTMAVFGAEVTEYELTAQREAEARLDAIREQARNYAG
jgi:hypothetical protein